MLIRISRKAGMLSALAGAIALLALVPLSLREVRGRVWGMIVGRPDRPVIWVEPPRLDFGRVKPLAELDATFKVRNLGSRPLELQPPTASCGCQKPTIDRLSIGPGEMTTLRVRQAAREATGPVTQMVFVKSNDPLLPELMIPMSLVVTKGVVVRPEPVYFGKVLAGESLTRNVEIVSDDGVPFKITYCSTGVGKVTASTELDTFGVLHRIGVTFRAGAQLGVLGGLMRGLVAGASRFARAHNWARSRTAWSSGSTGPRPARS
ncbi:MAG: DUF1573 domain-containing protein [Isosphaeraceae bacterium]